MLGDAYTLEYLPLFDEELAEAARYIACELLSSGKSWKFAASFMTQAIGEQRFEKNEEVCRSESGKLV